jgi:hypothetical protein
MTTYYDLPSAFTIFVYFMTLIGAIFAYFALSFMAAEGEALKTRIRRLSYNLQLAELQTGVPYFTAAGVPNAECENGTTVYAALQDRVVNTRFLLAPPSPSPPASVDSNPLRQRRGLTARDK